MIDESTLVNKLEKLLDKVFNLRCDFKSIIYNKDYINTPIFNNIELQEICGDMQEEIEWEILNLIQEIDSTWTIEESIKRNKHMGESHD